MPENKEQEIPAIPDVAESESEIMPVQDILQLIESKVADQVGELEIQELQDDSDRLTADDLETIVAEKMADAKGVDEEAVTEKINLLEDKLKSEAQKEFQKVEAAVGSLANEGRAKFGEVEEQVDTKLNQALSAGLGKIAEAEVAMAKKAKAEVDKAKEDGKAYLNYQMEQFKKEMSAIMDEKIKEALGEKS